MATTQRDLYEVLGVGRSATADELKKAYRKLAMQFHPDRNKESDAADRFKEVNHAYEVLSDNAKRERYDRFGHAGVDGGAGPQGFDGFSNNFEGFGDIFDAFFGGSRSGRRRSGPTRGADLRYSLDLAFEEAVFGAEKEITYKRAETCAECTGTGAAPGTEPEVCGTCSGAGEIRRAQQSVFGQFVNVTACPRCKGEGRVIASPCVQCRGVGLQRNDRTIKVTIPRGVDNGSQIRITGEGEGGPRGGGAGNLYVVLNVKPHKLFERVEDHILYELPVNMAQAALGATVTIPTLDGEEDVEIPAGTQSGDDFALRGHGVPHLRGAGRGDMIIRATVVVPDELTDEQRALLEQLAETLGTPALPKRQKSFFERLRDAVAG
jgi:molecular chaperone DnaJ